jgi:hypothetical protein
LESLLAEALRSLSGSFPPPLSLQEQALFGLGYYHQFADLRRKRIAVDSDTPEEEATTDAPTD